MRRKVLSLLFIALYCLMLTQPVLANTAFASAVFLNADTNQAINELGLVQRVKAKLGFSAPNKGNVSVITAPYDEDDNLLPGLVWDTVTVNEENEDFIVHTTTPISVTGAAKIRVFAWEEDTLAPLLVPSGTINKAFAPGEGFSQKLFPSDGITKETPYIAVKGAPVLSSDIFKAENSVAVNSEFFCVLAKTPEGNIADMKFIPDTSDWAKATLTFSSTGSFELTALDYDFCIPATAYINVIEPIDRYYTKFENTDDYLYRVGNRNNVSLSSLFAEKDADILPRNVQVEVTPIEGNANGTYTPNPSWEKGTIKFDGTGVVKVTIKDDYSKEFSLLLEVINAKNITVSENVSSYDVVLLNDIDNASFVVSNGRTFYGNGFTVTLPKSSVMNKGNGFTGYISIGGAQDSGQANGGNLDNVKIVGPVYPEMYIYRQQAEITNSSDADFGDGYNMRYFRNSVIVYGGNCTISNSYISGSRTALCLRGGNNIVIENTTLSGGAYANMQICSGSSVTLRNLTTVQTDEADSYGKGKTAHGLGIAVDSDVVDLYIEGELKQHNWLSQSQWNSIVPSNYQSMFPKFFTDNSFSKYWHYLNGGSAPYVNIAFIYACNWNTDKIHDNRATANYDTTNATIAGVSGGVYSKINTVGGNAITEADLLAPSYSSPGFNAVAPVFNFDNSSNNDDDDLNDAADTYCVYNETSGTLKIGLTGDSKTLDLSKVTIDKNGTSLSYKKYLNGAEISGNSVTIKAADGTKQALTFKATADSGYDKDGNLIPGEIDYTWTVNLDVATLAFPAPVFNMGGTYKFNTSNCVYAYYGTSNGYGEAVPIYEGIKINYYNKNGELVQKDFSGTTVHPTGSKNSNSNAFTYTLDDGSTLVMKFSSGWKSGATTHQFTTYNKKVYIYPQSLDNDNYIRAKTTNQDFDVKITYTFTDPNGQSTNSVTMNWYNAKASNGNVETVQWKKFDSTNGKEPTTCVTGDTLVTLADGSYKRIDEVTCQDKLLVWDFYNGEYAEVPPSILFSYGEENNTVITLYFDDLTQIKIINLHQFFDTELNKFVSIDENNVADFVGHGFIKRDDDGYKTVKLTDYEISKEYIKAYGIISAVHYNILVEDMFSTDFKHKDYGLFNYFNVGEDMMFDPERMAEDIKAYGLYSYGDFSDYLTQEQFEAFNTKYMKVAVGKGQYTFKGILDLINEYLKSN